jgi:microcystin-dependent protein
MSEPFIGEIDLFPYYYVPGEYSYLACNGQTLLPSQFQALFSLISNIYGGNATTTFNVPNLMGTTAVGVGQAIPQGLTWQIANTNGAESVTLNLDQYPSHNHTLSAPTGAGTGANTFVPQTNAAMVATNPAQFFAIPASNANTTMHPDSLTPYAGGGTNGAPHENRQPYLVLLPCIAAAGLYPIFD